MKLINIPSQVAFPIGVEAAFFRVPPPGLVYNCYPHKTQSVVMDTIKNRPSKRPRVALSSADRTISFSLANTSSNGDVNGDEAQHGETPQQQASSDHLYELVQTKEWERAAARAKSHPEEVSSCTREPSMLALSCRLGAPYFCVKEILDADPRKLRHLLDARGTPLHEAIVCDDIGPKVVEYLLKVDEDLDVSGTDDSPRAAMMQDVDGYTPLHLLIRRRFQSHVLETGTTEGSHLMEMLELLVRSCAEAVVIPDRGEYEESPIVMAIKANVYAPMLQPEEATAARIERHIFEMVDCMLQHYPSAANCVFNGYRGQYTALHSAVFHGRCPETIELLLNAERAAPAAQKACLLGNTQGELPLHFCAMRGEPPRTVALLAEAAPEAISQRDASGLTPMHWLWIRFVSTLLAMEDGRGVSMTVPLITTRSSVDGGSSIEPSPLSFASLEQGDFEADFQLLRRVDPSVDFLRMRHIPVEVQEETDALQWADRTASVLTSIRDRFESTDVPSSGTYNDRKISLTRLEAISALFWTKVVSLLKANTFNAGRDDRNRVDAGNSLVRTAFESDFCPPLVARIVATVCPRELSIPDDDGRVALHYAALRPWHAWEWPRDDGTSDAASSRLLNLESASLLRNAMSLSPIEAARQRDNLGLLPIHYMISTSIQACCVGGRPYSEDPLMEMMETLGYFVQMNPDALSVRDPRTSLFPFLQASAEAAQAAVSSPSTSIQDQFSLSIVFFLLRENPSLVLQRGPD